MGRKMTLGKCPRCDAMLEVPAVLRGCNVVEGECEACEEDFRATLGWTIVHVPFVPPATVDKPEGS